MQLTIHSAFIDTLPWVGIWVNQGKDVVAALKKLALLKPKLSSLRRCTTGNSKTSQIKPRTFCLSQLHLSFFFLHITHALLTLGRRRAGNAFPAEVESLIKLMKLKLQSPLFIETPSKILEGALMVFRVCKRYFLYYFVLFCLKCISFSGPTKPESDLSSNLYAHVGESLQKYPASYYLCLGSEWACSKYWNRSWSSVEGSGAAMFFE